MPFSAHQRFLLTDRSFAHTIKKDIHHLAESFGLPTTVIGKMDIAVSELTSNLIKYTPQGGEILVKPLEMDSGAIGGVEIICLDNGPGMGNVTKMMEDGVSTFGSKGEGLGAVQRQSDEFDIYSVVGQGTVVLSRFYAKELSRRMKKQSSVLDVHVVMVPKPGEAKCGDAWAFRQDSTFATILAADGLGHGDNAYAAAQEAVQTFMSHTLPSPSALLGIIHDAIRKSRGAVGAIASIDQKNNNLYFSGIGNIAGRIFSAEGTKNLLSYNGILGHNRPTTMNDHLFTWNNSSLMILHSDGLKSRWDLSRYPDIRRHDLSITAAVLYRDFSRKTDDTLVIVGKSNHK